MRLLSNKNTGDSLTAVNEWDELAKEVENIITTTGIALAGGNTVQVVRALAIYVSSGTYYIDSGAANAYVLTSVGILQSPVAYSDGQKIRWIALATNTGATTVNVAGVGVVDVVKGDTTPLDSGLIVAARISEAFFDLANNRFVLESKGNEYDIQGLTSALPNTDSDTMAFFDASAAANRKMLLSELANRTYVASTLSGNISLSANADYTKHYIKTIITNVTITIDDNSDTLLNRTMFMVTNAATGGSVFVNPNTSTVFTEENQTGLTQIIVRIGETKIFYRRDVDSYNVTSSWGALSNNRTLVTEAGGITGTTNAFDTDNNFQDYRRLWEKITVGSAEIQYVAQNNNALVGTSFVVLNRAPSGNFVIDMSAASLVWYKGFVVSELTVAPGASKGFLAFGQDAYQVYDIIPNPTPTPVSNYAAVGTQLYLRSELDLLGGNFFVAANITIDTLETVGPTGSGADNEWDALDELPTAGASGTVTHILLRVTFQVNVISIGFGSATLYNASSGTVPDGTEDAIAQVGMSFVTSSQTVLVTETLQIPVESGNIIRIGFTRGANVSTAATIISLVLKGYNIAITT